MEQRNPQDVTALRDVAYVICYGHFPCSDSDRDTDGHFTSNVSKSSSPLPSPSSTEDDGSPLSDSKDETDGDLNPFGEDDSDDQNPFAEDDADRSQMQDLNPFAEDEPDKSPTEDPPPFNEEASENLSGSDDKNLSTETADQDSQKANTSLEVKETPATQQPVTPSSEQATTIQPLTQLVVNAQPSLCPPVDSSISTLAAKMITNTRNVSRNHAKEIIAEAFNLTKFDLNRLVQDTRRTMASPQIELLLEDIRTEGLPVSSSSESYPVIFLRARLGDQEHFTSFSSTSASNTIQQNFTLGIRNMYNDILVMEVWSANKLPEEEPPLPLKLDLLGRIMTGSIRRKKNDKITKPAIVIEEPIKETAILDDYIEDDTPHDVSQKSQSPEGDLEQSLEQSSDPVKDTTGEMHNGITGNDDINQSLDKSDSVSISSEISSDPFKTSTPRQRSSSLQHLEVTNVADSPDSEKPLQKAKGFRNSFRMKSGLTRAFKRSNQNLSDSVSSPAHSRRGSDTSSIQLENGDNSSHGHINEDTLDSSKEIGRKPKLDREVSRSTLSLASITSLTRRKFSIKKTTQAMKRIGSIRGKKENNSSDSLHAGEMDHPSYLSYSPNESSDKNDSVDGTSNGHASMSFSDLHETNTSILTASIQIAKSPRPMREFKNLMRINVNKDGMKEASTKENLHDINLVKVKEPDNPPNVQGYLSSINKGHLQAEILASTEIPLKDIVGTWVKDAWLPMTLRTLKSSEIAPVKEKSRRGSYRGKHLRPQVCEKKAKVLCRMHVRLVLPEPGSELLNSAYDTYSITYSKLINMQVQNIPDLTTYKGSVGQVGKIILQQLIFFSRVSKGHQNLAGWLVLSEKKPADSVLLYPLLKEVKTGLQNGEYTTTQKQKLSQSLSNWVRYVIPTEFEVLHSAFPACSEMLEPSRLENFLRCFKLIEEDGGLRILFEREMTLISFPSLTDQLKGALEKHAEIWIDALNKEPVNQDGDTSSKAKDIISSEDLKWLQDIKRAASLTSPIVGFLYIGVQTYQSIFMVEMSVDYLYWVIPKFIAAALHLTDKTKHFTSAQIHKLPEGYDISLAAQSAWKVCSNLSDINKIGVECKLPLYLIEQEYRTAFSTAILQWLALSEILSLKEIESDIQHDEFVAVHPDKGYSQSALSMVDLLRAIMTRLRGLSWPGGVRPGVNTLTRFARHIIALVTEYKKKVIHAYNVRGGSTDKIPTQVCVVVRNVEHVCHEAKQYLEQLATWAKEESQVQEELSLDETTEGDELKPEGRNEKLQSIIDDTAEKLLQKCLPRLEELLTQGVCRESPDYVIGHLETALRPIEDRLYIAEPLLYALWYRLLQHATCLKNKFNQGDWRKDLQRLQKVIAATYTFLIDSQKVECQRLEESIKEYEKLNDELTLLGASSSGLIAQYYSERHSDQGKAESSKNEHIIVFYAALSRDGLKVHVLQAPGNQRGVLVKARVEPEEWFPNAAPQKTRLVKDDKKAVFDEHLHFPEVTNDGPPEEKEETNGIGGVLVLQLRTPRIFGGSIVHDEAIIPLAYVPRGDKDRLFTTQFRLPLTRPWSLTNYKPLDTLKSRVNDKVAMEFLKVLHARWEGAEEASAGQETLKVSSSFLRASSMRFSTRSAKRSTAGKTLPVK